MQAIQLDIGCYVGHRSLRSCLHSSRTALAPTPGSYPSYLPVPGIGLIVVNSYLIESEEPVVIDTGMPIVRQEFLENLWSLIDPKDVKWVFLTHDDADHSGSLIEVLSAATNARLVTQFIGFARLETAFHMRPERMHIMNPGQTLNLGDRQLACLRPPLFDSPATMAVFDGKSRVLFSADSFGAFIPSLGEDVTDIPEAAYAEGFGVFNRANHPCPRGRTRRRSKSCSKRSAASTLRSSPAVIHRWPAAGLNPTSRPFTISSAWSRYLGPEQGAFETAIEAMKAATEAP